MRMLKLLDASSPWVLTLAFGTLAFGSMLLLPGCNVNVKKGSEGEEKKVDIETPIGGLHVSKNADIHDVGLPVYAGARRKESKGDGDESSANVNISSNLFGLRVVAIEYLSDDPPEKLVDYYKDQLKKYGSVLECHTSKNHAGGSMDSEDDSSESKQLKCEGDNNGKIIELKVGTTQNQHIVAIRPADSGKGSDFGLVYVQMRGGKETI
jgi:hypothetical protein